MTRFVGHRCNCHRFRGLFQRGRNIFRKQWFNLHLDGSRRRVTEVFVNVLAPGGRGKFAIFFLLIILLLEVEVVDMLVGRYLP